MSLDFQQLHQQVKRLGEEAPVRERQLKEKLADARDLLEAHAQNVEALRAKVERAARQVPNLRCARPETEALTGSYPPPELPPGVVVLAADGSQVAPDRHIPVGYYLVNVGAICLGLDSSEAPEIYVRSELHYGDELYTAFGTVTEGAVTLERDLKERRYLADLAADLRRQGPEGVPVVTLTDGTLELWGAKERAVEGGSSFRQKLEEYKQSLKALHDLDVITTGYVDKPRADMVLRLLELATLDEDHLDQAGRTRRFRGLTDRGLYRELLAPGARSAVFGLQSQSVDDYTGPLELYFFYLNVGREEQSWPVRVEIPAWVAGDQAMLDTLQAALIQQCRVMGGKAYPYALHRAHEAAVVTYEEKGQLTQMIILELRRRGVNVDEISFKQGAKNLPGRERYK
jgi:hypothetical protein